MKIENFTIHEKLIATRKKNTFSIQTLQISFLTSRQQTTNLKIAYENLKIHFILWKDSFTPFNLHSFLVFGSFFPLLHIILVTAWILFRSVDAWCRFRFWFCDEIHFDSFRFGSVSSFFAIIFSKTVCTNAFSLPGRVYGVRAYYFLCWWQCVSLNKFFSSKVCNQINL